MGLYGATSPDHCVTPTCHRRAGEYSSERLKELKQNALSYSAAKFGDEEAAGAEPIIKLQGTFKAALAKDDRYEMGSSIAVVSERLIMRSDVQKCSTLIHRDRPLAGTLAQEKRE